MSADEFCPDNIRNIGEALVVQHAINVLPVFDQLFRFKLANVFVFVLQLLQPQSYAINAGNIRTFACQLALEQVPKLSQLG